MISVNQFLDLSKNAKVAWRMGRDEFPSVRQLIANIKNVSERTSEYSDLGAGETARRRDDGDEAYKGTLKQGYTKNFTQAEIALQVDVTKQMRKFDKYDQIMSKMRRMGKNTERRMEMDIASMLSYAWSTSYTNIDGETVTTSTPDGLALIDDVHTCNGSSSTFSNELGTTHDAISVDTLEALEELGNGFLDQADGRAIPVQFNSIITGRHAPTVHTVNRILGSDKLQGTTDNDMNDLRNAYKHIVVPFIDLNCQTEARDTNKQAYVFLANLGSQDENGFLVETSQGVEFETPEQVFETGVWQFGTSALYDFGTLFSNFIVGTKGDGSAV